MTSNSQNPDIIVRRDPDIVRMLSDLYEEAQGTHLGQLILESVAAVQQHGQVSVRLGVNQDGSISVFCADPELASVIGEALRSPNRSLHIGQVPSLAPGDFRALLEADLSIRTTLQAEVCGIEATMAQVYDRTADGWSASRARSYVTNVLLEGDSIVLTDVQVAMSRAALEEPDCCTSEGRFRALLNEALRWKADQLDPAVALVRGTENVR